MLSDKNEWENPEPPDPLYLAAMDRKGELIECPSSKRIHAADVECDFCAKTLKYKTLTGTATYTAPPNVCQCDPVRASTNRQKTYCTLCGETLLTVLSKRVRCAFCRGWKFVWVKRCPSWGRFFGRKHTNV